MRIEDAMHVGHRVVLMDGSILGARDASRGIRRRERGERERDERERDRG
jgi:hypothetical protein